MADAATTLTTTKEPAPSVLARPYWLPDTQGFLAIAIVAILFVVILVLLLKDYTNLNEKVYGALLTLLGVVAACFKDVYSFFFGSSRGSEKKDDVISNIATSPSPTSPLTSDQVAEATLTNGQRTYYGTLTDPEQKKKFLGMSDAERNVVIGKG